MFVFFYACVPLMQIISSFFTRFQMFNNALRKKLLFEFSMLKAVSLFLIRIFGILLICLSNNLCNYQSMECKTFHSCLFSEFCCSRHFLPGFYQLQQNATTPKSDLPDNIPFFQCLIKGYDSCIDQSSTQVMFASFIKLFTPYQVDLFNSMRPPKS